jgi:hypothetical protein
VDAGGESERITWFAVKMDAASRNGASWAES